MKLSASIGFDFFNFTTNLQSRKEKLAELAVPHNVDVHTLYKPGPRAFSNTTGSRLFQSQKQNYKLLQPNVGFILLGWFH